MTTIHFIEITTADDLAALPDGSLIRWQPVPGDDSGQAVAYVRKVQREMPWPDTRTAVDVWIAPGNGWEPEGIDVVTYPVEVILLGKIVPGDQLPIAVVRELEYRGIQGMAPEFAAPVGDLEAVPMISGGTYPRDLALQAASAITAQTTKPTTTAEKCIDVTLQLADAFASWLIAMPGQLPPAINALVQSGISRTDDSGHIVWQNND